MEVWKDVVGYEGKYQVSNMGNVRSLDHLVKRNNGRLQSNKGKLLRPAKDQCGYHRCAFSISGKLKTFKVHRLVAKSFLDGESENRFQVNHKNGIKTDNRAENLEWVSGSENCKHSFDTGLQKPKRGTLNGNSKLTEQDVKHIRHEHNALGVTFRSLSLGYKIDKKTIAQICRFGIWKHIGK